MKRLFFLVCILVISAPALRASEKPKVEIRDGDRIVFVGNEFFEREQDRGYIETELTTRFPDKNLIFRNLGYSGDTVRADARNLCSGWELFGPADQGFSRLKSLIEHIKPTLVFVAYGMNESFDGEKGLEPFVQDLNHMLDMLSSGSARIVLVSPIRHEDLGRPLPDPSEHNKNLQLYFDAMEKVAGQRRCAFINLFQADLPTSDGIHLTPYGYWLTAMYFEQAAGLAPLERIEIDARSGVAKAEVAKVADVKVDANTVQFSATRHSLPLGQPFMESPRPGWQPRMLSAYRSLIVQVSGLAPGRYALSIDDQLAESASNDEWAHGVRIDNGPDGTQEEKLRLTIRAKNFDFFNFWRPDNDTYIFGYRKHEQGRNAVEIPQFEPLVEAKEAEIAKLRVPVSQTYVLKPEQSK